MLFRLLKSLILRQTKIKKYETSLHFEIKDGQIIKEIRNDGGHGSYNRVSNPLCDNCPHANVIETSQNESPEYDMEWLKKEQRS